MAKNERELNLNIQTQKKVGSKFLDKINHHWYSKPETNKITFCNSIDDIIDGKGETFNFKEFNLSYFKNEKNKEINRFVLFHLVDGSFILTSKRNEFK
jgi:hypothetical protein